MTAITLSRTLVVQLGQPGKYQTACKPGMIGDGLRGDFTVTGDTVHIDAPGTFKPAPTIRRWRCTPSGFGPRRPSRARNCSTMRLRRSDRRLFSVFSGEM
jgi:hypothetical protein